MTDELAPFRETIGQEALSEQELNDVRESLTADGIQTHGDGFIYRVECHNNMDMTTELRPLSDESILEAMRHPMRYELTAVAAEVMLHKEHTGFTAYHSDECQAFILHCPVCDNHWDIDSRSLLERLPEARENVRKLQRHRLAQPPQETLGTNTTTIDVAGNTTSNITINTANATDLTVTYDRISTFFEEAVLHPEYVRAQRQHKREKAKAEKKARQLLFRCITRDQIRTYKKLGYIKVRGQDGRTYKIDDSGFHNVTTMIDGVEYKYCLMAREKIPPSDTVLAQKFWLETDIEGFLATANQISPPPKRDGNIYLDNTGHLTVNPTPSGVVIPEGVEDNLKPWLEELISGATQQGEEHARSSDN